MITEIKKNDFLISTNRSKMQLDVIHQFLSNSYWAKGTTLEHVEISIQNSLCFGVFHENKQIGFARVISDFVSFAYLKDVFILEEFRGLGLSKWLLETILNLPELKLVKCWMLKTADAHALYSQFGFSKPLKPEMIMEFYPRQIKNI